MLHAAAVGTYPPADGSVAVLPSPPGPAMGVIAFTARWFIATSAPEGWVREQLPPGDMHAPMSPRFLSALAERLGRWDDGIDVVLAAPGLPGEPALSEITDEDQRSAAATAVAARRERVRVFSDAFGAALVTIGRGLALRSEIAIEVDASRRGQGIARSALVEARRLVGSRRALFAQIAPGNAASLRAFLGAGFRPVGSEILFFSD